MTMSARENWTLRLGPAGDAGGVSAVFSILVFPELDGAVAVLGTCGDEIGSVPRPPSAARTGESFLWGNPLFRLSSASSCTVLIFLAMFEVGAEPHELANPLVAWPSGESTSGMGGNSLSKF